jgi:hypothetical protein
MQYKILNKENAIELAESKLASYGNTYKISQKAEAKTESQGEGPVLDLTPLNEFIKPMQDEWERLKIREDYPTWSEIKRNIHFTTDSEVRRESRKDLRLVERLFQTRLWDHCLKELNYEEKWLLDSKGKKVILNDDRVESIFSAAFHQVLSKCGVSHECLLDYGFWKYITLSHLWWYVQWRQDTRAGYSYKQYTNPKNPVLQPVVRAFNRGRLCELNGSYELAFKASGDTEFWQSAILGRVTSYWKKHTAAWVEKQFVSDVKTNDFRKYVQGQVCQNRSNLFIPALSEAENKAFFNDAYEEGLANSSS